MVWREGGRSGEEGQKCQRFFFREKYFKLSPAEVFFCTCLALKISREISAAVKKER